MTGRRGWIVGLAVFAVLLIVVVVVALQMSFRADAEGGTAATASPSQSANPTATDTQPETTAPPEPLVVVDEAQLTAAEQELARFADSYGPYNDQQMQAAIDFYCAKRGADGVSRAEAVAAEASYRTLWIAGQAIINWSSDYDPQRYPEDFLAAVDTHCA